MPAFLSVQNVYLEANFSLNDKEVAQHQVKVDKVNLNTKRILV